MDLICNHTRYSLPVLHHFLFTICIHSCLIDYTTRGVISCNSDLIILICIVHHSHSRTPSSQYQLCSDATIKIRSFICRAFVMYAQYCQIYLFWWRDVETCTLDMYNMVNKSESNLFIWLIISITINHNLLKMICWYYEV